MFIWTFFFIGDVKRYDSVKYQWGVIFISLQEFKDPINGYLVNDTCVLGAEVYVVRRPVLQQRLSISNMVNVIYNYTWKLTHFSELVDDECFSDAFDIGSYKWYFHFQASSCSQFVFCTLPQYLPFIYTFSVMQGCSFHLLNVLLSGGYILNQMVTQIIEVATFRCMWRWWIPRITLLMSMWKQSSKSHSKTRSIWNTT